MRVTIYEPPYHEVLDEIAKLLTCYVCNQLKSNSQRVCRNGHMMCLTCFIKFSSKTGELKTKDERARAYVCGKCKSSIFGQGDADPTTQAIIRGLKKYAGCDEVDPLGIWSLDVIHLDLLQKQNVLYIELAKNTISRVFYFIPVEHRRCSFVVYFSKLATRSFSENILKILAEQYKAVVYLKNAAFMFIANEFAPENLSTTEFTKLIDSKFELAEELKNNSNSIVKNHQWVDMKTPVLAKVPALFYLKVTSFGDCIGRYVNAGVRMPVDYKFGDSVIIPEVGELDRVAADAPFTKKTLSDTTVIKMYDTCYVDETKKIYTADELGFGLYKKK